LYSAIKSEDTEALKDAEALSYQSTDSKKSQNVGSKVMETVRGLHYSHSEQPPELTPRGMLCLSVSVGQLSGHMDDKSY